MYMSERRQGFSPPAHDYTPLRMAEGGRGGEDDREVLGRLPRSRPHRRSTKRDPAKATAAKRPAGKAAAGSAARSPAAGKAASPRAKAPRAAKPRAAAAPAPTTARPGGPRSQRPATSSPTASPRIAQPRKPPRPPTGADLLGTAVQAAGEIAQAGVTVGRQLLKRAVSRLPRP
jgi:hypothetical protein